MDNFDLNNKTLSHQEFATYIGPTSRLSLKGIQIYKQKMYEIEEIKKANKLDTEVKKKDIDISSIKNNYRRIGIALGTRNSNPEPIHSAVKLYQTSYSPMRQESPFEGNANLNMTQQEPVNRFLNSGQIHSFQQDDELFSPPNEESQDLKDLHHDISFQNANLDEVKVTQYKNQENQFSGIRSAEQDFETDLNNSRRDLNFSASFQNNSPERNQKQSVKTPLKDTVDIIYQFQERSSNSEGDQNKVSVKRNLIKNIQSLVDFVCQDHFGSEQVDQNKRIDSLKIAEASGYFVALQNDAQLKPFLQQSNQIKLKLKYQGPEPIQQEIKIQQIDQSSEIQDLREQIKQLSNVVTNQQNYQEQKFKIMANECEQQKKMIKTLKETTDKQQIPPERQEFDPAIIDWTVEKKIEQVTKQYKSRIQQLQEMVESQAELIQQQKEQLKEFEQNMQETQMKLRNQEILVDRVHQLQIVIMNQGSQAIANQQQMFYQSNNNLNSSLGLGAQFSLFNNTIANGPRERQRTASFNAQSQQQQPISEKLDMAYLFADPIVKKQKNSDKLVSVSMPLDLEAEYETIIENLESTGKTFTIEKIAMNTESLKKAVDRQPKIIHMSSHGAYDQEVEQYYLAIEDANDYCLEDKIHSNRISTLLDTLKNQEDHGIKLAFISACHSEKIGDLLSMAGIPIVIAVQSGQQINDDVCKMFSKYFYSSLLDGQKVIDSFNSAKSIVQAAKKSYSICCCAHDHDEDCEWYKFFKKDPEAAHEMHSQDCPCPKQSVNGKIIHKEYCNVYHSFKKDLMKKKEESIKRKKEKERPTPALPPSTSGGGLASMFFAGADDDLDALFGDDGDGLIPMNEVGTNLVGKKNDQPVEETSKVECVLCCCRPDKPHDESMKFQFKIAKGYDEETVMNWRLFEDRSGKRGELVQVHENKDQINNIQTIVDRKMIQGKHIEVHDTIKFLIDKSNQKKRMLIFTGQRGTGSSSVAQFAIKYVLERERQRFQNGAILIDAANVTTSQGIYQRLSKGLKLSDMIDKQDLIDEIKSRRMIIIIDHCFQYIESNKDDFQEAICELVSKTQRIQFILITHLPKKHMLNLKAIEMKTIFIHNSYLEQKDAAQIMHEQLGQDPQFRITYPKPINLMEHDLFKSNFKYTPLKIFRLTQLYQNNGDSLDDIFKLQDEQLYSQGDDDQGAFNKRLYERMKEKFPEEIDKIHLLSLAKSGLTIHDIEDIQCISQGTLNCKKNGKISSMLIFHNDNGQISIFKTFTSIVKTKESSELHTEIIYLERSFNDFVTQVLKEDKDTYDKVLSEYLKYMGLLSRQILDYLKPEQNIDFNPYIVSAQQGYEFWRQNDCVIQDMQLLGDDVQFNIIGLNQDELLDVKIKDIFFFHEFNFSQILSVGAQNEDIVNICQADPKLIKYLCEMIINIPSVFITLEKRNSCALHLISQIEEREMNFLGQINDTLAKLKMIKASVFLDSINIDFNSVDQILAEANIQIQDAYQHGSQAEKLQATGEIYFLNCLIHIFKIDKISNSKPKTKNKKKSDDEQSYLKIQKSSSLISRSMSHLSYNSTLYPAKNPKIQKQSSNSTQVAYELQEFQRNYKIAKDRFKNSMLGKSKLYYVFSELILDKLNKFEDELDINNFIQQNLMNLNENLEDAVEIFGHSEYDLLKAKCLFQQAKIEFKLGSFIESRQKLIQFMEFGDDGLNSKLIKEYTELLKQVCFKIQQQFNNVFIFAKSLPIDCLQNRNTLLCNQIFECKKEFEEGLAYYKKKICLKYDILNNNFLQNLSRQGCSQVLHLTPFCPDYEQRNQRLLVEDYNFKKMEMTAEEVASSFKGTIENIQVVLLELTNCSEIAQMFLNQKVNHVIYFKTEKPKNVSSDKVIAAMQKMDRHQKIIKYMTEFSMFFYKGILNMQSVSVALQNAHYSVKNLSDDVIDTISFEHIHSKEVRKDEQLFEEGSDDPLKQIDEGEVQDISHFRAQSNLNLDYDTPYVLMYENNFQEIVETVRGGSNLSSPFTHDQDLSNIYEEQLEETFVDVNDDDSQDSEQQRKKFINLHGDVGLGKSQLIKEVVKFMQYRHMFGVGIYNIDLSTVKDFDQIQPRIIALFRDDQQQKTDLSHRKSVLSQSVFNSTQKTYGKSVKTQNFFDVDAQQMFRDQQIDKGLIIFDNADVFEKNNAMQLKMNLNVLKKKFKNLTFIFLSSKEMDQTYNLQSIKINPFKNQIESCLLIQNINPEVSRELTNNGTLIDDMLKITKMARGNPQLLEILVLIFEYGGMELVEKVKVKSISDMQSELEEDYQLAFGEKGLQVPSKRLMNSMKDKFGKTKTRKGSVFQITTKLGKTQHLDEILGATMKTRKLRKKPTQSLKLGDQLNFGKRAPYKFGEAHENKNNPLFHQQQDEQIERDFEKSDFQREDDFDEESDDMDRLDDEKSVSNPYAQNNNLMDALTKTKKPKGNPFAKQQSGSSEGLIQFPGYQKSKSGSNEEIKRLQSSQKQVSFKESDFKVSYMDKTMEDEGQSIYVETAKQISTSHNGFQIQAQNDLMNQLKVIILSQDQEDRPNHKRKTMEIFGPKEDHIPPNVSLSKYQSNKVKLAESESLKSEIYHPYKKKATITANVNKIKKLMTGKEFQVLNEDQKKGIDSITIFVPKSVKDHDIEKVEKQAPSKIKAPEIQKVQQDIQTKLCNDIFRMMRENSQMNKRKNLTKIPENNRDSNSEDEKSPDTLKNKFDEFGNGEQDIEQLNMELQMSENKVLKLNRNQTMKEPHIKVESLDQTTQKKNKKVGFAKQETFTTENSKNNSLNKQNTLTSHFIRESVPSENQRMDEVEDQISKLRSDLDED